MTYLLPLLATGHRNLLVHVFVVILGGTAVIWGAATFLVFWRQAPLEYMARHIIQGEPYNADAIARQVPAIEAAESATFCRPIALWSAAVIRLRMVEQAGRDGNGKLIDAGLMKILDGSIRRALSCSAADPFLWMVLDWVESTQSGFKQGQSKYLSMSYQLGPNEGWIALKRNPVALAKYDRLSPAVKENAINELLALINSEFYQQAADILSGPARTLRQIILPRLAALPQRRLDAFAKTAYGRGLNINPSGIRPPNSAR